ncbi:MAG: hypothetical protein ACOYVK_08435 [Bacillota bacterium]
MNYKITVLVVLIVVVFFMMNYLKRKYKSIPSELKKLQNEIIPIRFNIYKDFDKTYNQVYSQKKAYNRKYIVLIVIFMGSILFFKNIFNNYDILIDKVIFALIYALSLFMFIFSIYYDIKVLKEYQLISGETMVEVKKFILTKNVTYLVFLVIIVPLLLDTLIFRS